MQSNLVKSCTAVEFAAKLRPEEFNWPYRDEVNGIYFKSQHPTEPLGDKRHQLNFLIHSDRDEIDYYLTCETLSDDNGDVVRRGFPRQITFDKSQVFSLIDKMRAMKKKTILSSDEKQKIFDAFMKSVFLKNTGFGKCLDDVQKMSIVIK